MFPLKDDNPTELFPIVTLLVMAGTVAVWVYVQGAGLSQEGLVRSVCSLGVIPAELSGQESVGGGSLQCTPGGLTWATLVTSVFLHGSWMHLIGNLWFLWIFGNNIEDSMGHLRFLVFYLVAGAVAAGAHVVSVPGSGVPTVGASGAISAIMGAYVVLYPRARVVTLFIIVIFIHVTALPAWLYLGYWFAIQLFSAQVAGPTGAGVAFWAHIGGFVAGVVMVKLFENPDLVGAKRRGEKLSRDQIRHGGWY